MTLSIKTNTCPACGEEWPDAKPQSECTCGKPLWIAIPPGRHIHIQCPVHGDVKIYGPSVRW